MPVCRSANTSSGRGLASVAVDNELPIVYTFYTLHNTDKGDSGESTHSTRCTR